MITKAFQVRIDSAGYIEQHPDRIGSHPYKRQITGGFGFQAEAIDRVIPDPREASVIITPNSVYIDNPTLSLLVGRTRDLFPKITYGNKGYYDIQDDEIFESLDWHSSYPSRSQREQEVKDRNRAILGWLVSLL
jgi:hypothetical protein